MSTLDLSQEPPKPFYKQWPFWFIFLYLSFIAIYTTVFIFSDGENIPLSSNELGDFLAGAFAPLAFLFLYLGYKQQGEELRSQAKELANSVEQQKALVKIATEELDELKDQFLQQKVKDLILRQPAIHCKKIQFQRSVDKELYDPDTAQDIKEDHEYTKLKLKLVLWNSRSVIRNSRLLISTDQNKILADKSVDFLGHDDTYIVDIELSYPDSFNDHGMLEIRVKIDYSDDLDGNHFQEYYLIIRRDSVKITFGYHFFIFNTSYPRP